ncbi:carbohydrate ABC transporter substrate-binding protein (CUT1 family) [Mobilisporobacter senegalensis]|uniref:Carbohydrate ABC transporter substrate-binding protein (CUT1 family) n=1 Tax=Mobilisporobacter senegalensis TaxID=1329262 RepID=A0A3N1X944_9FIRM|nr:ABC transporter substrate-binding protein [Mobilisporobacter senegalensis]ROR21217.1 carbohydrate ABC transporter substrate-binding protein (CUT1 family) [Mobilisporobacter senegalensis]
MKKSGFMEKTIRGVIAFALISTLLAGCGKSTDNGVKEDISKETSASGGTIDVDFWTAPEQYNLKIWTSYADKFNAAKVELNGKTIKLNVQMMPAQPSSEAGIQNAIATGTVPAISENINRSFANILNSSEALYDISSEDWYKDIVAERQIENVMEGWEIEGAQYVIPLYVNPIGYCYNSKALQALGVTEIPQTMDDFNTLLTKYKDQGDTLSKDGISHFMYRAELLNAANYWERWFDIESQYNAFSKGTPLVDGNMLTADKDALTKVFALYGSIGDKVLTGTIDGLWQQETVPVVMGIGLPWDVSANIAAGKTYGIDGDYVFGPTLVENEGDTHYNYADSKGIVLYKNDAISEEEHQGAIEFLKFVFTGEGKDTFDIDWLNATTMLPVRGDLEANDMFASYFGENPALKDISTFVADAIPGMAHEKGADIITALGEKAVAPFATNLLPSVGINENPDVSSYVDDAMEAMKTAGELE